MVTFLKKAKYWLGWSLVTLVLVKIIQSGSLTSWMSWLFHRPLATLLNIAIILSVFLIFHALFASRRAAAVMGLWLMLSFALIHALKIDHLQDNLYAWDFLIVPEMITLIPSFDGAIFFAALLPLLIIPITLILIFLSFKQNHSGPLKRLGLFVGSFIFLCVVSSVLLIPRIDAYLTGMTQVHDYIRDYERNGLMFSFARTVKVMLNVEAPQDYSEAEVKQILVNPQPLASPAEGVQHPNVIIVMSEALFDPTDLPLHYSKDPLKNLHSLQAKHGVSSLISPSFGGNTCNTEFELLTGLSMNFFPPGSLPYQHYIRRDLPALPRIFKENGYQTLAIHPYRRSFFSRESIYRYLGFDDYISLEDWDNPEMIGDFVSDKDVMRKIIQNSESLKNPFFIFAITMQNHQPFTTPLDPEMKITSGDLSEASTDKMLGYLSGLQDADESLLELIQSLEKSSGPTLLIYFGDHLPAMPTVYSETEYFKNSKNPFAQYTVPALIWSNHKLIPPMQNKSIFYLGQYILKLAGIQPPLHFQFLGELSENYPVISYEITQDGQGALLTTHELIYANAGARNMIQNYWILQHDLIFGEQHLWVRKSESK